MKSHRRGRVRLLSALILGAPACGADRATQLTLPEGARDGSSVSDANSSSAADSASDSGAYATVQAAIDAAVAKGGTDRVYIRVLPGTYREVVCVGSNAPPITLYGTSADPTQTVIAFDNYNGKTKTAGAPANPCTPNASATTYGTAGSATFSAFANGFDAKNITFSNDATPATLTAMAGSGTQAVALMTEADRVILENVRVLGHQDTLYVETPNSDTVVRTYMKGSYVAGDVDFIFGGASFVLDATQIQFVSDRTLKGQALAPSTDSRNPHGILVSNGNFTADPNTAPGAMGLGRAWDRSCGADSSAYLSMCVAVGHYPNGQAVVRNSILGPHVDASPWLPSATTKRPYCNTDWPCAIDGGAGTCPANRLYEYQNTGPGSAVPPDSSDAASATCTNPRPQLADAEASDATLAAFLAQAGSQSTALVTDNWDPTAGVGDVSAFAATYTVGVR
jgi:pectinesterase